jgi:hypothetical protein
MNTIREKLVVEPERYEFSAPPIHQFALRAASSSRFLALGSPCWQWLRERWSRRDRPGSNSFHDEELPREITSWLHVGEDGIVTGFTGKTEIWAEHSYFDFANHRG